MSTALDAVYAGDLTIQAAAAAKDQLLAAARLGEPELGELQLDLSGVTELDTAGLQLLLLLRRELAAEGRTLVLARPSDAVSGALALGGLLETMDVA
jgi:anti-sigma B factor antagonist